MSDVSAVQHYVVEIDGVKYSEHARFVDASRQVYFSTSRIQSSRSKFAIFLIPNQKKLRRGWWLGRKQVSSRFGDCLLKSLIEICPVFLQKWL